MAIVVDAARAAYTEWGDYKIPPYTKGNSHPNTPNPSFQNGWAWLGPVVAETHITARNDVVPWVGINNTADAWVPMSAQVHTLDKTENTWRPA